MSEAARNGFTRSNESGTETKQRRRVRAEAPTPGDRGQGSPAGSMQYYQKALAIQPDSMPAQFSLAEKYWKSADPDLPELIELRRWLEVHR